MGDPRNHGTKVVGTLLQFAPKADLVFYSTAREYAVDWNKVRMALEDLKANHNSYDVKILSMSMGSRKIESENPQLANTIANLLQDLASYGITIFISTENKYDAPVSWPASIAPDTEGIISVGGVFDQDYSNWMNEGGDRYAGEIWHDYPDPDPEGEYGGTSHGENIELMATSVDVKTTSGGGGGRSSLSRHQRCRPNSSGFISLLDGLVG